MPLVFIKKLTKKFFIFSNILVAILFLLGCYSKYFSPQKIWFIGFFTLASICLLILLVLFFIFWILVKPAYSLISVIAVAAAYQPTQNLIPFRLSSTFNIQKPPNNFLRVMSWNVAQFDVENYTDTHDSRVYDEMIQLINKNSPDIACFQEMVCGDTTIPVIRHINDFTKALHYPFYLYTYHHDEDWKYNLHFGKIIFSKYPIINSKEISHKPFDYNSSFQYVDIVKGDDTVRVFNIHLESLRFSNKNYTYIDESSIKDKAERLQQSKEIISKLKRGFLRRELQANWIKEELDKSPYPIILCGDFNDVPNSYAYGTIGTNLQNAFAEKGHGIGRSFSTISPTLRIDNIFVDKRFTVQQFTRIKKKLSDHYPVIADIAKNNK